MRAQTREARWHPLSLSFPRSARYSPRATWCVQNFGVLRGAGVEGRSLPSYRRDISCRHAGARTPIAALLNIDGRRARTEGSGVEVGKYALIYPMPLTEGWPDAARAPSARQFQRNQ